MKKLLVICGPTATGKTSLGIKVAKEFSGEIVSADSRQVYKGMDIGTGKDLPANSKRKAQSSKLQLKTKNYKIGYYLVDDIPIWLLDIVSPDYQFSVADYVECADLVIKDIWKRKKLPILVGGTGFYIKGVVDGIETIGIKPDLRLREKMINLEIEKLREELESVDPKRLWRMNQSDRKNPRRLIRAIEIAKQTQSLKLKTQNYSAKLKTDKILFIGLTAPYKILYQRIDKRVDEQVKQGIIEEIRGFLEKGYSWENSVLGETIGYKEWKDYFKSANQRVSESVRLRKEIIQRWKYDEHGYARRQMTWFRKDQRIHWLVDISQKGWENDLMSFLRKQESI